MTLKVLETKTLNQIRALSLFCMTMLTTACGGGSSDKNANIDMPQSSVSQPLPAFEMLIDAPSYINDGSVTPLPIVFIGAQGDITVTSEVKVSGLEKSNETEEVLPQTLVKFNAELESLEFDAKDLKQDEDITVTVLARDEKNRTQEQTFQVKVINTSGETIIEHYQLLGSQLKNYMAFVPEREVILRLSRLVKFTNPASKLQDIDDIQLEALLDNTLTEQLLTSAEDIPLHISKYRERIWNEDDIQTHYLSFRKSAFEVSMPIQQLLVDWVTRTNGTVPQLEFDELHVDTDLQTVSQFVGNLKLGRYENDTWFFHDSYAFLTSIVISNQNNCNAQ